MENQIKKFVIKTKITKKYSITTTQEKKEK